MSFLQQATSPVVLGTLWLLIAFSIVTWAIIFMKGWQQWRLRQQNHGFQRLFWQAKGIDAARKAVADAPGPLAQVSRTGFSLMTEMRRSDEADLQHSGDLQDILERGLRQEVQNQQGVLDAGLAPLASIGATAPFVGLFGTVWGIMHALQDIGRSGSAGLDVVAGPVGEALIATAVGIAAAVPAVLAYNYFLRRLKVNVAQLENFATDFLHLALKHERKR
jgi:biopolymer transport protein ExbB